MKAIEIDNIEEKLREMIEVQNLTHRIVGERFGVENQTISKWCRKFGIKVHRTGPRSGSGHPDWKGGVRIVKGYRYIYSPDHPKRGCNKTVAEHRLVMEKKLNRLLETGEIVHHIDGNKQNNSPDNLILTKRGVHEKEYHSGPRKKRVLCHCGRITIEGHQCHGCYKKEWRQKKRDSGQKEET